VLQPAGETKDDGQLAPIKKKPWPFKELNTSVIFADCRKMELIAGVNNAGNKCGLKTGARQVKVYYFVEKG